MRRAALITGELQDLSFPLVFLDGPHSIFPPGLTREGQNACCRERTRPTGILNVQILIFLFLAKILAEKKIQKRDAQKS
jgi:hypothetical protein